LSSENLPYRFLSNAIQCFKIVLPFVLVSLSAAAAADDGTQTALADGVAVPKEFLRKLITIPVERELSTAFVDFSAFSAGDVVSNLGDGIVVMAQKKLSATAPLTPGQAMIFDSAKPSGDDWDLGTPNTAYGGPGVGNGGRKGKLYANKFPQGNLLMISEDENASNPDDNKFGGTLKFLFDPPRYIDSIGLLDNDEGTIFEVMTVDGGSAKLSDYSGGDNSFQNVAIGKPSVKELTVTFIGSGAISKISFEKTSCKLSPVADFSKYVAGDVVSDLGNGLTVAAFKDVGDNATAMIFDTAAPTGGDIDLGCPNKDFGGPGVGKAGKKGKLFANSVPKGKALIISEDDVASNPDDRGAGGFLVFKFTKPTYIDSIGLLDNDESTLFTVTSKDGGISHFFDSNGGDNSFELVKISKPGVIQLTVVFLGSGAITEINTCA
jgi:hypothetical protein